MKCSLIGFWLTALAFSAPAAPAMAQDRSRQQAACANVTQQNDFQSIVEACTALIQSGRLSGPDLAIALSNRGAGYSGQKDYTRALVDLSEAIRLNPRFAMTFYNRGNAYRSQ